MSQYVTKCHQTSLNFTKCQEMSPNVIKCHQMPPNVGNCGLMLTKLPFPNTPNAFNTQMSQIP